MKFKISTQLLSNSSPMNEGKYCQLQRPAECRTYLMSCTVKFRQHDKLPVTIAKEIQKISSARCTVLKLGWAHLPFGFLWPHMIICQSPLLSCSMEFPRMSSRKFQWNSKIIKIGIYHFPSL